MKKVTVFVGSARKKLTHYAVRQFLDHLQSLGDIEYEVVTLSEHRLETCRGCCVCFKKGEEFCPLKDDRDVLFDKIMTSDESAKEGSRQSFRLDRHDQFKKEDGHCHISTEVSKACLPPGNSLAGNFIAIQHSNRRETHDSPESMCLPIGRKQQEGLVRLGSVCKVLMWRDFIGGSGEDRTRDLLTAR